MKKTLFNLNKSFFNKERRLTYFGNPTGHVGWNPTPDEDDNSDSSGTNDIIIKSDDPDAILMKSPDYVRREKQDKVAKLKAQVLLDKLKPRKRHKTVETIENQSGKGDLNRASLIKLLSKGDLSSLYKKMTKAGDHHAREKGGKMRFSIFDDTSKGIYGVLKNAGYESAGIFGPDEVVQVYNAVVDTYNAQEMVKLPDAKYDTLSRTLFDFNMDGKVDAKERIYVGEAQMRRYITSESDLLTFLKNINVIGEKATIKDVKSKMGENLTLFRTKVKNGLFRLISAGIPPSVMANKLGINKFLKKGLELQDKYLDNQLGSGVIDRVNEELTNSQKIRAILGRIPAKFRAITMDKIRLTSIGLLAGGAKGLGMNFSIDDYFEFGVGIVNGIPVVTTKLLKIKQGNANISVGTVYVVPFVDINGKIWQPKADKMQFEGGVPSSIDTYSVSAYAGTTIPPIAQLLSVGLNRITENTQKGIKRMTKSMGRVLSLLTNDEGGLKKASEFRASIEKSFPAESAENIQRIMDIGKHFQEFYNKYKNQDPEIAKRFLANYINGYSVHYENELYRNAKDIGPNFSGISLGLTLIAGFLPIPFASVRFERFSQTPKVNLDSSAIEHALSGNKMNRGEIGLMGIEERGNIITIPDIQRGAISSSVPGLKYTFEEGGIRINAASLQGNPITISELNTAEGISNIIIIGKPKVSGNRIKLNEASSSSRGDQLELNVSPYLKGTISKLIGQIGRNKPKNWKELNTMLAFRSPLSMKIYKQYGQNVLNSIRNTLGLTSAKTRGVGVTNAEKAYVLSAIGGTGPIEFRRSNISATYDAKNSVTILGLTGVGSVESSDSKGSNRSSAPRPTKKGPGVTDKPAPVTQQDVPAHPDNLFGTQNIPGATPNNVAPAPVTQVDVPAHPDNLF